MKRSGGGTKTQVLKTSLLTRLLDEDPSNQLTRAPGEGASWQELLDELRQDIVRLLNTRQFFFDEDLEEYPEARASLLTYGFPDLTSTNPQSPDSRDMLKTAIERQLRRFEPRLLNIRVTQLPIVPNSRVVQYRLEAHIRAQPRPRRVVFDASVDIDRLECRIEEEEALQ